MKVVEEIRGKMYNVVDARAMHIHAVDGRQELTCYECDW